MARVLSDSSDDNLSPAETFKAFELTNWNLSSEHYARSFATLTNKASSYLLDTLELFPQASLLDICCGNGALTAAAHMRGANVVGIDFSSKMLEIAKATYPHIRFEEGDAEALAVPDSCFDYASMSFGLVYLGQPHAALKEAARVIVCSGRFACSVWDYPEHASAFRVIFSAIKELGEVEIDLSQSPDFFQFANTEYAKSSLKKAGFTSVEHQKHTLLWDLGSATELFDAFYYGTGRTGSLLRAQPAPALDKIRSRVQQVAEDEFMLSDGSLRVPMTTIVYCAQK